MKFKRLKKYFRIDWKSRIDKDRKVYYFAKIKDLLLFADSILFVFPRGYESKNLVIEHIYTITDKNNKELLLIRFKALD